VSGTLFKECHPGARGITADQDVLVVTGKKRIARALAA